MTPNQQVLSDEQLCEALTTAYGSPEWTMDDVRAARAIESATLAALAQQAQPVAWLPIESAPKDGTEIILRRGSRVGAGMWVHWPATEHEESGQGWTIGFDGDSWDDEKAPTEWQPLPPTPQTKGQP